MIHTTIIIPAFNEAARITKTIEEFFSFSIANGLAWKLLVVLNGCVDNTKSIVEQLMHKYNQLSYIELREPGKGRAVKAGFMEVLKKEKGSEEKSKLIGFVDADLSVTPHAFYDLTLACDDYELDGVIASRYMDGAKVYPERPRYKTWGRRLIYNPLIQLLFKLPYQDIHCGGKVFKRHVIEVIAHRLTVPHWAFDVELLNFCQMHKFFIKEYPIIWYDDQKGSKFTLAGGIEMLLDIIRLRFMQD
jgi:glycosyltransferase involved in cell wall biosynthesis